MRSVASSIILTSYSYCNISGIKNKNILEFVNDKTLSQFGDKSLDDRFVMCYNMENGVILCRFLTNCVC
jgi:hypothetical protein